MLIEYIHFAKKIADGWSKVPDLRFGQLMVNFFQKEFNSDPFYVEDLEFLSKFHSYINEITGGKET